jgi:hypothetical protein
MAQLKTIFIQPINGLGQIDTNPIDARINNAFKIHNISVENLVDIQVHQGQLQNSQQVILFFSATIIYIDNGIVSEN